VIGRWLLACYPRAWRDRYGEELLALAGDRLDWKTAIDIGRAALSERRDQIMGRSEQSAQPSSSVFYGVGDFAREVRRELWARVPGRASSVWGVALGATFVLAEVYGLLVPTTNYAHRSQWFGTAGLAICFCAGSQAAWRRRDFAHGGIVTLFAILIGFCVAIVGDVVAVLVISRFRQLDLATQLYWAIEVPLPIMLMVGGFLGTVGAALASAVTRLILPKTSMSPW
jgi:hypothetical protein